MTAVLTLLLLAFAGWAAPRAACWEEGGARWCGALDAAKSGVNAVHIIDGRVPHSVLIELLTDEGIGTMFEG